MDFTCIQLESEQLSCDACSDEQLSMKCGIDAVHYQKFQRYLLVYLAASSVLCLCIILPINVSQGSFGKYQPLFIRHLHHSK